MSIMSLQKMAKRNLRYSGWQRPYFWFDLVVHDEDGEFSLECLAFGFRVGHEFEVDVFLEL